MLFRRLAIAAAIALPRLLEAQHGPLSPIILQLPSSTRALGLGNTGVASRDDDVIFYNPARLVNATGFSASGEWMSSTSGTGALSAVTRFNGGGIGIGARFANYELSNSPIAATRANMVEEGLNPGTSLEATIGFAQTIKGYQLGVAAKYAEEISNNSRISRPLADIGVAHDFFRTTFGLAVQNIGSDDMDIRGQSLLLPVRTTLGAARGGIAGPLDYYATAAVSLIRDDFVQPSGGAELSYSWLSGYNVAVRAGARRPATGEEWFTAGAGFTMDRLTIEYALETLSNQRVGNRFGLRVR